MGQQRLKPFLRGPTLTVLYAYGISERKQSCGATLPVLHKPFWEVPWHGRGWAGSVHTGRGRTRQDLLSSDKGPQESPKRKWRLSLQPPGCGPLEMNRPRQTEANTNSVVIRGFRGRISKAP